MSDGSAPTAPKPDQSDYLGFIRDGKHYRLFDPSWRSWGRSLDWVLRDQIRQLLIEESR